MSKMFKVKIEFVNGSRFDYTSKDDAEPNKIRHSLENNAPLWIIEGNRTIAVLPQNIIFVDVIEDTQ